jgi:hypothetical protein
MLARGPPPPLTPCHQRHAPGILLSLVVDSSHQRSRGGTGGVEHSSLTWYKPGDGDLAPMEVEAEALTSCPPDPRLRPTRARLRAPQRRPPAPQDKPVNWSVLRWSGEAQSTVRSHLRTCDIPMFDLPLLNLCSLYVFSKL